jgi:hypothetical protein
MIRCWICLMRLNRRIAFRTTLALVPYAMRPQFFYYSALASYTQPCELHPALRVTPSPASYAQPCELHPALGAGSYTQPPWELHPALRVTPSPASYIQPCELHPALRPEPGSACFAPRLAPTPPWQPLPSGRR